MAKLTSKQVILPTTTQCEDWSVKFEFNINGSLQNRVHPTWSNILGFTADVPYGQAGYRQPHVYVRDGARAQDVIVGIRAQLGTSNNWGAGKTDYTVTRNEWHSIEIEQQNGWYSVRIDGDKRLSIRNMQPKKFEKITGYTCASDQFDCGVGMFRNLETEFDKCVSK